MPYAALAFYQNGLSDASTAPEQAHGRLSLAQLLSKLGRDDDARVEFNAAVRGGRG